MRGFEESVNDRRSLRGKVLLPTLWACNHSSITTEAELKMAAAIPMLKLQIVKEMEK